MNKFSNFAAIKNKFGKHTVLEKHYIKERKKMKEYIECFVQGRIDKDWVWRIENRVGPWVDQKGNSGYWDCVNIYSQYICILKKGLIRKDFAGLIVAIRPKGLKEGKTKEQLKNSMDQCPLSLKLDKIETYSEDSECRKIIKELKELFSAPIPVNIHEEINFTVKSRMKEYLEKRVATSQYTTFCNGKTYCGYTTTLSIEQYESKMFMNKNMPSSIFIIECIEEKVSDTIIYKMACNFNQNRKIKLVIAAQSGFDEQVKKAALSNDIRLIRVNPQYEITEKDILTPRMDCSDSVHGYEHKMLSGIVPMTVPLVIQDGTFTTTSLSDFLKRNGIPVNNPGCAHAPKLTREFIEEIVSQIIKKDVDTYVYLLKRCGVNDKVPYCIIDPYQYAKRDKLKIIRSDLSKQRHLGHIDMKKKVVRLSNKLKERDPRDHFSMAHEYGHHKLHSHPKFREFLERDAELAAEASSDIWEKHWLEVQANVFASYMLMPCEIVELLYNLYWRKWFKSDKVKPLYVKARPYNDKNFQNVVGPIARHMGVSLKAMSIRLKEMGLLIELMESDVKKAV